MHFAIKRLFYEENRKVPGKCPLYRDIRNIEVRCIEVRYTEVRCIEVRYTEVRLYFKDKNRDARKRLLEKVKATPRAVEPWKKNINVTIQLLL
ncbi:hypothetical protein TNCV_674471 [Trichonephila clavipes]|nr:hypothetical protein TNCV_674471 [Trichonephila clavipes]